MPEHHSGISFVVPLIVGLLLVGLTFVVHAVAARYLIKFVHWRRSLGNRRWDILHDLRLIFVTALAAFSAHLLDICFWAALLMGIDRSPGIPGGLLLLGRRLHNTRIRCDHHSSAMALIGSD
jgi:hypothetical protein